MQPKLTYSHQSEFHRSGLARVGQDFDYKLPKNLIEFQKPKSNSTNHFHPTEKPIELMEYLVKTYSQEGEWILDFTCGAGSTLLAAKNLNRNCIGIDKSEEYHQMFQIKKGKYEQN